MSPVHMNLS